MSLLLARRFHRASLQYQRSETVLNVRDVLRLHGEASTPVILLIMATCCLMPVGGIGTVLSFAMVLMAWRWYRQQETTVLPERIARLEIQRTWAQRILKGLALTYMMTARWLKPRWSGLTRPGIRIWWALWIASMAFLIFLPIPFGNVLPGLSLMLFSLGWAYRDGVVLALSQMVGLCAMAFAAAFGHLAATLMMQAWNWTRTFFN
jgi:hypothetical protein